MDDTANYRNTDEFFTIDKPAEGLYKEKGSRFISFICPVQNAFEVKKILEHIKKEHHKSRHTCYAWRIGLSPVHEFSTDAGEPVHSAGPPILKQLQKHELTNVILVVVRYFGGTKLGVGGLINAYRSAAEEAISNSIIIKSFESSFLTVKVNYQHANEVLKIAKTQGVELINQQFLQECTFTFRYRITLDVKLRELFSEIPSVKICE